MNLFKNPSFKPMLLTEIKEPFQSSEYLYEVKFDGMRALLFVSSNFFQIQNRHGKDVTFKFPELKAIKKLVQKPVIFDGEIVAFLHNKPNFMQLQKRIQLKNSQKIEKIQTKIPVVFVCFDILYENKNLINEPLIKRKKHLEKYPDTSYFIKSFIFKDGITLFQKVQKLGLEGIVAKKKDSPYEINSRSTSWLKIKNIHQDVFAIGGYSFKDTTPFATLYIGEVKQNKLYYITKVAMAKKNHLFTLLQKIKQKKSSFEDFDEKDIYYVPVKYFCLVSYLEKTAHGLRHPVFKGLVDFD